jgi:putative copper resistance protein D
MIATADPTDLWVILRSWSLDPLVIVGLGTSLWWYLRALARLRAAGSGWPRWRAWSFTAGIAVLFLSLASPLDVYAERLLSVHMVQHLLLTLLAPPLLLLGAPLTLAVRTATGPQRSRLLGALKGRTVRVLSNPVLGWTLFVGTIYVTHLPSFYDATIRHMALHAGEHLAYLLTALLFWRPIVGSDPGPSRLSYPARLFSLFLLMPAMTFLGLAIYGSDIPIYAPYVASSPAFGTSAVADQHLAGALMWSAGMLFIVPAMAAVLVDWMRTDEREAQRADARLDRAGATTGGRG